MVLRDKIDIRVNPNTRLYYNSIGYKCENYDIISINVIHLPKGSSIHIDVSCDVCNAQYSIPYNKYLKNTSNGTDIYSCKRCSYIKSKRTKLGKYGDENYRNIEKTKKTKLDKYGDENYNNRDKSKQTCMEKYGVENVSSLDFVKDKKANTSILNWGVSNPFMSDTIKNKINLKILEKYHSKYYLTSDDYKEKYKLFCHKNGVKHYSQSSEFKSKYEETCLIRWGFKSSLQNEEIRQKIKKTLLTKYGFDNPMKNIDISNRNTTSLVNGRIDYFRSLGYSLISYDFENCIYKLEKDDCGHVFETTYDLFRSRVKYKNNACLECFPKNDLSSIKERELLEFIKGLCPTEEILINDRKILNGYELDIYIPSLKIAFEFNGLYWHSDKFKSKNYHYDKTLKCYNLGIQLIHIWEDDWIHRNIIIKSIITNRLLRNNFKLYARNCNIKIINNKLASLFLDQNHIQGRVNSNICIALEMNGEIVSLMTFGMRYINKKPQFELLRFCNKIGYNVLGAASKLFKYFLNNNEYENIISYSDNSLFSGSLYKNLGFENDGQTSLNYYWTDLNRRYHRFNFNKKRLIKMGYDKSKTEEEIMKELGYFKIWSCGQTRWIYKKLNYIIDK